MREKDWILQSGKLVGSFKGGLNIILIDFAANALFGVLLNGLAATN